MAGPAECGRGGAEGRDLDDLRRRSAELLRRIDGKAEVSLADDLTGAGNERFARLRLTEELARTRRFGTPASVLLVDIVDLKGINRRYGHEAGNEVLCRVAELLQQNRRGFDVLARLGGDNFLLYLNDTDLDAARRLGRRLRLLFGRRPLRSGRRSFRVGLNMACVAVGPGGLDDVEAILDLGRRGSRIFRDADPGAPVQGGKP